MPRTKKTTLKVNALSDIHQSNLPNEENMSKDQISNSSYDNPFASEVTPKSKTKAPENNSSSPIDYRHKLAQSTVKNWSQWATTAGFVPVPLLDTALISGVQVKMVFDLCKVYEVPFKKEAAIGIIGALIGGSVTTATANYIAPTLLKAIPIIGMPLSFITQPALSYASTFALGEVFVRHFESNGNLLNFNIDDGKVFFQNQFQKAKGFLKSKDQSIEEVVAV